MFCFLGFFFASSVSVSVLLLSLQPRPPQRRGSSGTPLPPVVFSRHLPRGGRPGPATAPAGRDSSPSALRPKTSDLLASHRTAVALRAAVCSLAGLFIYFLFKTKKKKKRQFLPVAGQQQFGRKQVGGSPNLRNRNRLRFKRPFTGEKFLRCCNNLTLNVVPKRRNYFSLLHYPFAFPQSAHRFRTSVQHRPVATWLA